MCGIAGIIDLRQRRPDRALLERMCNAMRYRGPDDEGYYLDRNVALGQRRLEIIDLAGGRQPMSNEDGTVWISFNGEIYNFQELRRQLQQRGHKFATRSDTEVIVHAYEEYGVQCVERLRGMFALAIWDQRRRQLLLARDRVGKKPLFYTLADGRFIFASELPALLAHPAVRRDLDHSAIDDYLTYGYIPAPRTPFHGVDKLPPAHYLTLKLADGRGELRELKKQRYWRLSYTPKLELDEEEAAEGLLEVLTEAVRLRMIADVPLGALLSGGIDSSLIVALMSRLSSRPVKTFSIGFDESRFDELAYARLVAERYATDHHELVVRPEALSVLPALVRHYGEPYADSSAIPSYYVAALARQHVAVVLGGDGGDENFAGYERYLGSMLAGVYRKIPRLARRGMIEPLCRLIPESLPRRHRLCQAKRFVEAAALPPSECHLRWVSYFSAREKQQLYSPEFRRQLAGYDPKQWFLDLSSADRKDGPDDLDALLAVDVQSYLPYDLLVKTDIASMANSLEARSPFLDHEVMEFCARLPSCYKRRGTTLKYLLKKIGRDLLPSQNVDRRKMGFGVPVGTWMRSELRPAVEDALLSPKSHTRRYFQPQAISRLVRRHCRGKHDHSFQLWALFWLEMWHREFLDD
jgi:asparagine synthase (glutamine-hydrolysing)